MSLTQARERAASRYPHALTDSLGRVHECIPRRRILAGDWDHGAIVRKEMEGQS